MGISVGSPLRSDSVGTIPECNCAPAHEAIREQLRRILGSAPFRNSERYRSFLQYVIERTLDGRSGEIKERSIGSDVLGRPLDYDTTSDPVVRITASEVRKRLAQYYSDEANWGQIRITLPSGAYVPEFQPGFTLTSSPPALLDIPRELAIQPNGATHHKTPPASVKRSAVVRWLLPVTALASFVAGMYLPDAVRKNKPADAFWNPVLVPSQPVLLSIGDFKRKYDPRDAGVHNDDLATPGSTANFYIFPTIGDLLDHNTVSWADAMATSRLAGFVQASGRTFLMKRSALTSLSDLTQSPSVLVGAFDNQWSMRLLAPLRFCYRYAQEPKGLAWIEDKQNPGQKNWVVDPMTPPSRFREDFGIIARFTDPLIERPIVVASGIAGYGTIAAGEFLARPKYLQMINDQVQANRMSGNIEVVFSTKIVDGNVGPPRILAVDTW